MKFDKEGQRICFRLFMKNIRVLLFINANQFIK